MIKVKSRPECCISASLPAPRYRLSLEEILSACKVGDILGYKTFVLQGGEDDYYTDEKLIEIIHEIKKNLPESAITLSIGERYY